MRNATIDLAALAARLAGLPGDAPQLIGITGSVAAGKSTLARQLAEAMPGRRVAIVGTDGFLLPNAVLAARGLLLRKGFPESYDTDLFRRVLGELRAGAAEVPGYSHTIFDIDPALTRRVSGDVVLVEGLGFGALAGKGLFDTLVYLDAADADLEAWYVGRFMTLWRAAEHDPASFYTRFRHLDAAGTAAVARQVWADINLPNLHDHILPVRALADIVIAKDGDHRLTLVRG